MKNHTEQTICIAKNLTRLRQYYHFSQEATAEKLGVTRQAIAKWESGDSVPDLLHCEALARLYGVTLDDLIHYDETVEKLPIPPKGKHLFGTVTVGERGQIVLPKKSRNMLGIQPGDILVVLGDENPGTAGIALVPGSFMLDTFKKMMEGENADGNE